MNIHHIDRNYISSYILIITAGIILIIFGFTDRKDISSAAIIIAAMALFLTGILLFTFAKKPSIDGHFSSLIPVQNQINICRIVADLGIMGNAWFLPKEHTGSSTVMEYVPVSTYRGGILENSSFISMNGETGILLFPAGNTIKEEMEKKEKLVVPETMEEIFLLIRETGEDLLEISDTIQIQQTGEGISIRMNNYLMIEGCQKMREESPGCCLLHPCAICSLFGIFLAEGLHKPVMIEQCRPENKSKQVEILYNLGS